MKAVGIIAEYNPFHTGHQYQLDYVRKECCADYIVVVMSGDYVQRGAPALFDKYTRAKMALNCGADLVLELPVSVSTASAEYFSSGAVSVLNGLGIVDELCFGSECGDVKAMLKIAEILNEEPEPYKSQLQKNLKNGLSFPAARSQALEMILPDCGSILSEPNNILGIEYCRALLKFNSKIRPVTIQRQGAGYHEKNLSGSDPVSFTSASAIRANLKENSEFPIIYRPFIPGSAYPLFKDALLHQGWLSESDMDSILNYALLYESSDTLTQYADVSPELADRIIRQRNYYQGFEQFSELLKTKELTRSRIQRALLHILLKVRETHHSVPYARVLGFRKAAAPVLSEIKKRGNIPLITKAADAESLLDAKEFAVFEENTLASNLYESILSGKTGRSFVHEYQKQIVLL